MRQGKAARRLAVIRAPLLQLARGTLLPTSPEVSSGLQLAACSGPRCSREADEAHQALLPMTSSTIQGEEPGALAVFSSGRLKQERTHPAVEHHRAGGTVRALAAMTTGPFPEEHKEQGLMAQGQGLLD